LGTRFRTAHREEKGGIPGGRRGGIPGGHSSPAKRSARASAPGVGRRRRRRRRTDERNARRETGGRWCRGPVVDGWAEIIFLFAC
jgi:hypothetical protein